MNRQCITCNEIKPHTTEFFFRRKGDVLRNECKPCMQIRKDKHIQKDKDAWDAKRREIGRRYYYKDLDQSRDRANRKAKRLLLKKLGITDSFDDLLKAQNFQCKICLTALATNTRLGGEVACIDHCHETNTYRGILCTHCNKALGLFKDNIDIIYRSIAYLNESKKTS